MNSTTFVEQLAAWEAYRKTCDPLRRNGALVIALENLLRNTYLSGYRAGLQKGASHD